MKTFFILLLSLIILNSRAQKPNNLEKMEKYVIAGIRYEKNPYYAVQVYSVNCNYILKVNDLSVDKYLDSDGGISGLIPINQSIYESKIQDISVQIMPNAGSEILTKHATFKMEVRLYKDVDDAVLDYVSILNYQLKVPEEGMPALFYKDTFNANVPYKIEGWSNSKDLRKDKNIENEVFEYYKDFQKLLLNKSTDSILSLVINREKELNTVFYYTKDQAEESIRSSFECINKPNAEIQSLDSAKLVFYANGRIVCLEMPDGETALRTIVKNPKPKENKQEGMPNEGDETFTFSLMLHKPKGSDKLEVIR